MSEEFMAPEEFLLDEDELDPLTPTDEEESEDEPEEEPVDDTDTM